MSTRSRHSGNLGSGLLCHGHEGSDSDGGEDLVFGKIISQREIWPNLALPPRSVMISGICIAAFWIRICIAAFLDVWWQGDPVFLSCALNTPSHLLSSPPLPAIPP